MTGETFVFGRASRRVTPAGPIRTIVPGSPYQPGETVRVLDAVDSTCAEDCVGRRGVVVHLEYSCGCGQSYPRDPMIGVRFEDERVEEFWREELGDG